MYNYIPLYDEVMTQYIFYFHHITGDDPIGELFSPGYDCSKILDSNPEAKDGFYWIHLGGYYPKQVRNNILS